MNIQELTEDLEANAEGKWRITKKDGVYRVEPVDQTKEYIIALNERISQLNAFVIWPTLLLYIAIIIFVNTSVSESFPAVQFLAGWLPGILLFIALFILNLIVGNRLMQCLAPKYLKEFQAKARELNFTRDEIITASWAESKAPVVRNLICNDKLRIE